MKFVKIPKDRIGVLIGPQGATKDAIEHTSSTHLDINSEDGEVVIDDHESKDPIASLKTEDVIRAIGRGFSPEHAMRLFAEDADFYLFDIRDYVGKRDTHIRRLKSRVIGRNGKTKRYIERLTGANISVYGHTVAVIVDMDAMDITRRALDMLLSGSKHYTVYAFIEREMKKKKHEHLL
jgi:ribosomal RNA assembly protein